LFDGYRVQFSRGKRKQFFFVGEGGSWRFRAFIAVFCPVATWWICSHHRGRSSVLYPGSSAALGLRVILLDFNLVNVKYQRALIWGLTGLGLVVFVLIWKSVY